MPPDWCDDEHDWWPPRPGCRDENGELVEETSDGQIREGIDREQLAEA